MTNSASTIRSRPLSLRQNFSWTFIGNLVYAAMQWAMLIVLTKVGTTHMVGLFTLGLSVTAPIIMLTNAQLRNVQAADVSEKYTFGDYFGLRLVSSVLALLLIVAVSLISQYPFEAVVIIVLIGLAKFFEAISNIIFGLAQQREQMDLIGKSQIIKGIFSFILLCSLLIVTNSVFWAVIGLVVAWLLVLLFYDIPNSIAVLRDETGEAQTRWFEQLDLIQPRFATRTLIQLGWIVAPLGFVALLNSLVPNLPRYAIESQLGVSALGIFGSLAYITIAGDTVVMAMGHATTPRLARHFLQHETRQFLRLILILIGILLVMSLVGVLVSVVIGREFLTLLYQPEYAERADVFVWLMIAAGVIYLGSFLGYVLTAIGAYRSQLVLVGIIALFTGAASFVLIPDYGLTGAALAMLIGGLIRLIGTATILFFALTMRPVTDTLTPETPATAEVSE